QKKGPYIVERNDGEIDIQFFLKYEPLDKVQGVYFFPEKQNLFNPHLIPDFEVNEDSKTLTVKLPSPRPIPELQGVVVIIFTPDSMHKDLSFQISNIPPEGKNNTSTLGQFITEKKGL